MTSLQRAFLACGAIMILAAQAEDAPVSPLQKNLIGQWVSEKDKQLHTYYSAKHRLIDRDIANTDAAFAMMDYQVWEVWPELRTIILSVNEGTLFAVMIVITFNAEGTRAVCREKTANGWTKSFAIVRVDDKTHPATLPNKLKILDIDNGVNSGL